MSEPQDFRQPMLAADPLEVEEEEGSGGLRVPDLLGPPRSVLNEIRDKFSATQQQVDESLRACGLPNTIPEPSTTFPSGEVTSLHNQGEEAYGRAYDQNMAWLAYLTYKLSEVQSLKMAADTVVKLTAAQLRRQFSTENRKRPVKERYSQDELDTLVLTHAAYVDALVQQQRHTQNKQRLEGLATILNKNISAISRHITLRGQELFRNHGAGGFPIPQGFAPTNPLTPRPRRDPNGGMDPDFG